MCWQISQMYKTTTWKHFRVEKCNVPHVQQSHSGEPDVRDGVSLLWIVVHWDGGVLLDAVASSCWEFWVECALEYPSWRKSRGPLSALTSPTAPGNALHSSSWQLLGHFQKGWGKNAAGLFSGAFGTREWKEPKERDWKHMAAWEYLWLWHLFFPPSFFPEITRWERAPPPPNAHSPLRFQRMTPHMNWHPLALPLLAQNDFQVGTTCVQYSCFIC